MHLRKILSIIVVMSFISTNITYAGPINNKDTLRPPSTAVAPDVKAKVDATMAALWESLGVSPDDPVLKTSSSGRREQKAAEGTVLKYIDSYIRYLQLLVDINMSHKLHNQPYIERVTNRYQEARLKLAVSVAKGIEKETSQSIKRRQATSYETWFNLINMALSNIFALKKFVPDSDIAAEARFFVDVITPDEDFAYLKRHHGGSPKLDSFIKRQPSLDWDYVQDMFKALAKAEVSADSEAVGAKPAVTKPAKSSSAGRVEPTTGESLAVMGFKRDILKLGVATPPAESENAARTIDKEFLTTHPHASAKGVYANFYNGLVRLSIPLATAAGMTEAIETMATAKKTSQMPVLWRPDDIRVMPAEFFTYDFLRWLITNPAKDEYAIYYAPPLNRWTLNRKAEFFAVTSRKGRVCLRTYTPERIGRVIQDPAEVKKELRRLGFLGKRDGYIIIQKKHRLPYPYLAILNSGYVRPPKQGRMNLEVSEPDINFVKQVADLRKAYSFFERHRQRGSARASSAGGQQMTALVDFAKKSSVTAVDSISFTYPLSSTVESRPAKPVLSQALMEIVLNERRPFTDIEWICVWRDRKVSHASSLHDPNYAGYILQPGDLIEIQFFNPQPSADTKAPNRYSHSHLTIDIPKDNLERFVHFIRLVEQRTGVRIYALCESTNPPRVKDIPLDSETTIRGHDLAGTSKEGFVVEGRLPKEILRRIFHLVIQCSLDTLQKLGQLEADIAGLSSLKTADFRLPWRPTCVRKDFVQAQGDGRAKYQYIVTADTLTWQVLCEVMRGLDTTPTKGLNLSVRAPGRGNFVDIDLTNPDTLKATLYTDSRLKVILGQVGPAVAKSSSAGAVVKEATIKELSVISLILQRHIVEMIQKAGSGHPGGSLSAIDIITALYFGGLMRYYKAEPRWKNRDRFVLSKGHAAPALYAALAEANFFSKDELLRLRQLGARLQGHTDMSIPGVDMSAGSLGVAFSAAVGMALAAKMDDRDCTTYAMLGDGEIQEGQVTEAAEHAAALGLDNLIAFVDCNGQQIDGDVRKVNITDQPAKWQAMGWNVFEIDGHNIQQIIEITKEAKGLKNKRPVVIFANTKKGYGLPGHQAHGSAPSKDDSARSLEILRERLNALMPAGFDAAAFAERIGLSMAERAEIDFANSERTKARLRQLSDKMMQVSAGPPESATYAKGKKVATRTAGGEELLSLGAEYPGIVALCADLKGSVKMDIFAKAFGEYSTENPTGRYVACGIREAHMASLAAGLASCGKIPVIATFSIFTARMLDQLNAVLKANLPIIIVGTHVGLAVGPDGNSHQDAYTAGLFAQLPNVKIYEPADAEEARVVYRKAVDNALTVGGVHYIRLARPDTLMAEKPQGWEEGAKKGFYTIFDSNATVSVTETNRPPAKVLIISSGTATLDAIAAAKELSEQHNIGVRVINVTQLREIERQHKNFADLLGESDYNVIITVQDALPGILRDKLNSVGISHGIELAVVSLGIQGFGESGPPEVLYAKHGIDKAAIIKTTLDYVNAPTFQQRLAMEAAYLKFSSAGDKAVEPSSASAAVKEASIEPLAISFLNVQDIPPVISMLKFKFKGKEFFFTLSNLEDIQELGLLERNTFNYAIYESDRLQILGFITLETSKEGNILKAPSVVCPDVSEEISATVLTDAITLWFKSLGNDLTSRNTKLSSITRGPASSAEPKASAAGVDIVVQEATFITATSKIGPVLNEMTFTFRGQRFALGLSSLRGNSVCYRLMHPNQRGHIEGYIAEFEISFEKDGKVSGFYMSELSPRCLDVEHACATEVNKWCSALRGQKLTAENPVFATIAPSVEPKASSGGARLLTQLAEARTALSPNRGLFNHISLTHADNRISAALCLKTGALLDFPDVLAIMNCPQQGAILIRHRHTFKGSNPFIVNTLVTQDQRSYVIGDNDVRRILAAENAAPLGRPRAASAGEQAPGINVEAVREMIQEMEGTARKMVEEYIDAFIQYFELELKRIRHEEVPSPEKIRQIYGDFFRSRLCLAIAIAKPFTKMTDDPRDKTLFTTVSSLEIWQSLIDKALAKRCPFYNDIPKATIRPEAYFFSDSLRRPKALLAAHHEEILPIDDIPAIHWLDVTKAFDAIAGEGDTDATVLKSSSAGVEIPIMSVPAVSVKQAAAEYVQALLAEHRKQGPQAPQTAAFKGQALHLALIHSAEDGRLTSGEFDFVTANALLDLNNLASLDQERLNIAIAKITESSLHNVLMQSRLSADIAKLTAAGTIVFNDYYLSQQQKDIIKSILGKDTQSLQRLEELMGCTIRLKSQLKPEDIKGELIIISEAKLDEYPNAKYLLYQQPARIDNAHIPAIPMIAMAKGLLSLKDKEQQAELINAIKELSRSLCNKPLLGMAIDNYLRRGVFILMLPAPKAYDYKQLEQLQRLALAALIAA